MLTRSIKTFKASSQSDVSHNWPKSSWNLKNIRNLSKNQKNLKKRQRIGGYQEILRDGSCILLYINIKRLRKKIIESEKCYQNIRKIPTIMPNCHPFYHIEICHTSPSTTIHNNNNQQSPNLVPATEKH